MSKFEYLNLHTDLKKITPWHMHNNIDVQIQKAIEKQLIRLNDVFIDFVEQLYLSTATWGLVYWENLVALEPDYLLTNEERRSRIKARLRSSGTTTIEALKSISEAFTNGKADVIEHYDEYYFVIKFISKYGIPSRIDELENAIKLIKPAHLDLKFEFKYRTWNELKKLGHTWNYYKEKGYTWNDLKEREVL